MKSLREGVCAERQKSKFIKWNNKSVRVESEEINLGGYKEVSYSVVSSLLK